MAMQDNLKIAHRFLEKIGSGAAPEEIASLFSADLEWHIPGDSAALPWIGRQSGRRAVENFMRDSSRLMERIRLEVHEVMSSDDRAVVLGELVTRIIATGKTIESPFVIVLTFAGGEISKFMMIEDSFAVAAASRP
ncbi:nuclear transport factor 2 family protein [Stenotrophomonas sp. TWI1149]|uniref:nuclear transport factor 2 family protein n=1 Tax=unclassified Stenotrophomonas TaxID=196198 RepID=UPI003208FB90